MLYKTSTFIFCSIMLCLIQMALNKIFLNEFTCHLSGLSIRIITVDNLCYDLRLVDRLGIVCSDVLVLTDKLDIVHVTKHRHYLQVIISPVIPHIRHAWTLHIFSCYFKISLQSHLLRSLSLLYRYIALHCACNTINRQLPGMQCTKRSCPIFGRNLNCKN